MVAPPEYFVMREGLYEPAKALLPGGENGRVLRAGAGEDAYGAKGILRRQRASLFEHIDGCDRRQGIGHIQDQRDPAGQRSGRSGGEIPFVLCAGQAEIGVDVDKAGEGD